MRYEARDIQQLAGLLADAGVVDGAKVGVTGGSYGGGVSLDLAVLRDRVMLPNGTLAPWTSPGGRPMRIAGAVPWIPWSDLADALAPNGRTLDYEVTSPTADLEPFGVAKLELLGRDAPYGRASNGTFAVEVRSLELRLPVRERHGAQVRRPLAPVPGR